MFATDVELPIRIMGYSRHPQNDLIELSIRTLRLRLNLFLTNAVSDSAKMARSGPWLRLAGRSQPPDSVRWKKDSNLQSMNRSSFDRLEEFGLKTDLQRRIDILSDCCNAKQGGRQKEKNAR